jgi:polyketide biosynthesis acyl carrier protein
MPMNDVDSQRIFETMRSKAQEVVPELIGADFTADRTLVELGCNSIDRAEIVQLTQEELGIVVPVNEFGQGRDIGTLVETMRKYT